MCRSLREQILCEKVSPPAAPRTQTDAGHALDVDHLKLSSTTRIWLMRLQRLECDYFVSGPDSAEAGADWMHGRAQHVRQAFFESLWAGYRTGALVLRKTFTAWRCLAVLPHANSEQIRKRGLERIQEVLEHLFGRFAMHHSLAVMHAWAQVVKIEQNARRLREMETACSNSLRDAVRAMIFVSPCSCPLKLMIWTHAHD